jgi:hypothetical protein
MQVKNLQKISNLINKLGVIILFGYFSLIIFFLSFYIHEAGHIIFGIFNNLLLGRGFPKIFISNWIDFPLIPFLKLPQQTIIGAGAGSLNFIFGGILFSFLFWTFFSLLLYKHSKQKLCFLIPLVILIGEITGNYFCGTDNITHNPLPLCNLLNLNFFVNIEAYIFAIILTIIFIRSNLFKRFYSFLDNLPDKINKKFHNPKPITKLKEININDPLKEKKIFYISGVNRVGDLINGVNRDVEDKITLFISIFFSALLGAFITAQMYALSLLTFGVLFLTLLIILVKEFNDKAKLKEEMNILVKDAKEKTGLDLRQ